MRIEAVDLVILLAYLLGMVGFGLWMGRKQQGSTDFMLGGRSMPWWLVLFSIVATETSTVTFLSVPGIAYGADLTWLQIPCGYVIGRLVVTVLLLPRYFRGELFTAYQILHERFGGLTQRLASVLFLITRTLADGLRLFLSALVLREVAGVPLDTAVLALGIATIGYTFVGGMRAVVWTDFVQFVVYMVGAGIAFALLLGEIDGGLAGMLESARQFETPDGTVDKLRFLDTSFDLGEATNLYAGLIGGAVLSIATHGVDQMMVQRYLSARSRGAASAALATSGFVVTAQFALFLLIGTGLAVYYAQQDPVPTFAKADRVFATFIVDNMPVGVLGIVLGAVFSAAMSTLSSSLNSSATAMVSDIWQPLVRPRAGDRERLLTVRLFVVVFGGLQILVGIGGQNFDDAVVNSVLAIAGFTTGIILGLFLLGMFVARASQTAALLGMLAGALCVGQLRFELLAEIEPSWTNETVFDALQSLVAEHRYRFQTPAWPWFALIGSTTTVLVGTLASLLFPSRTANAAAPDPANH